AQRSAFDELHRQKWRPEDLAHVEDRDGVGMVEGGGGPRLAREAVRGGGGVALRRGRPDAEDLQRDPPLELRVDRAIKLPHAAHAEQRFDDVAIERVAGSERHSEGEPSGAEGGPRPEKTPDRVERRDASLV